MDHDPPHDEGSPGFWRSRFGIGYLVLAVVAGWFLWTEHRAHLLGFLLQWPTLLTLVMFPILVVMYARLSTHEEAEMHARSGDTWGRYAQRTPRFIPTVTAAAPLHRT